METYIIGTSIRKDTISRKRMLRICFSAGSSEGCAALCDAFAPAGDAP